MALVKKKFQPGDFLFKEGEQSYFFFFFPGDIESLERLVDGDDGFAAVATPLRIG